MILYEMKERKRQMNKQKMLIACFSPKGGSGKTTTSTQLAISAKLSNETKLKVCFYDLDPQQTATFYFNRIGEKFRPDTILHDFNIAPPDDCDFIIIDCEPSTRFIPPKEFLIVAPTLASSLDLHAYRKVLELEEQGYKVIKVINQYSRVRKDDSEVKEHLDPCVIISANSGIRVAMNNGKTIWNSNHPGGKRAKHQFTYLVKRIMIGSAEKLSDEDISYIMLKGVKKNGN